MKVLYKYILIETLRIFSLTLGAFIFVLLLDRASIIAQTVLGQGISIVDFLKILIKAIPSFLGITIPMSLVLSVIIVFFSLSNNNEITAIKSCGINVKEVYKPIFWFSLVLTGFTFYSLMFMMPQSNVSLKKQVSDIIKTKLMLNISSNSFVTNFPGVTFYAERAFPDKGILENFMVSVKKRGESAIIFAKHGKIRRENDKVFLDIADGEGQFLKFNKPGSFKVLKFKTYTMLIYRFKEKEKFTASKYKDLVQLMKAGTSSSKVEIFKRLTLSLTPLIMGILAFSIGILVPRGSVGLALVISLIIIILYYIGYTVLKKLAASTGFYPLPIFLDVFFFGVSLFMYRMGLREQKRFDLKW